MADDINNNEGMDEAGDAGMPDDLKRLLARAEQGEDGDPDSYNPTPRMKMMRMTTPSSRRASARSIVALRPARTSTAVSSRFQSSAAR